MSDLQDEIKRCQEYAAAGLERNMLVYLKLSADDFRVLKDRARKAGVPYQTLPTNLVHKFVTGKP